MADFPPSPSKRRKVIDLVRDAGVDVSDWGKFKGGPAKAGANPKYCYNWSFEEPGKVVVLNLWHAELEASAKGVLRKFNLLRMYEQERSSIRKSRADAMREAIQSAYISGLPIRVILLAGFRRDLSDPNSKPSKASHRELDAVSWAVTTYDPVSGEIVITRGAKPIAPILDTADPELAQFREGEQRHRYILHRRRERKARTEKLDDARERNGGRIVCEVPSCGFDFFRVYGPLGEGYAHVHHLVPLKDAPPEGRAVKLTDLAVVCANCHAMIHLGGECRKLEDLIPSSQS